jgi:allophanate hydrolase
MTGELILRDLGPSVSIQDLGRPGYRAQGLMRGGAADPMALCEAASLLRQSPDLAALEMGGTGGTFEVTESRVIALTGGQMDARIDDVPVAWNACHLLPAGSKLRIGGARRGTYGYLSISGGIDAAVQMGSRSRHMNAGLGVDLTGVATLPLGNEATRTGGQFFETDDRCSGGTVRIVASMQTRNFSDEVIKRFTETAFRRDPRANRMGVRMDQDGEGFFAADTLSIVSEVIAIGDIQITGDGAPFVLLCECQTTGGYPRIGTVLPSDLPKIAQAATGTEIRFEFVTLQDAIAIEKAAQAHLASLASRIRPLIRDPHSIADLLSYQLVSGAVSAMADPFDPAQGT